jgi:hypothetical protein
MSTKVDLIESTLIEPSKEINLHSHKCYEFVFLYPANVL